MSDIMSDVMTVIILFGLFGVPIILILIDMILGLKRKKSLIFEIIAFGTGFVYMVLCWILWDPVVYNQPIDKIMGLSTIHEPLSREHVLTLIVIAHIGFFAYLILKYAGKHLAPLAKVFCIGGIYGGVIVNVLFLVQLLCGARPIGISPGEVISKNIAFFLCMCIVPILFLIHVGRVFYGFVRQQAEEQEKIQYDGNGFLAGCNRFLCKGANLYWAAFLAMIPLYGIVICILCLFGQKPDSVIKAFTQTSDWILSGEVSPPPVEYDAHYLCTVSLKGHRGLVKPIRYGIRRGNRIVVNRQLCVANAFEQLLQERTPRFHRAVRHFYDTYGYPVSKWITNPWSADVVYLIMKPLEWIFVAVLYLFDEKPENRICSQYLPIANWKNG